MNILEHAKRELKAVGYIPLDEEQEDGPNKWIQENVLELLEVFSKQGHSGMSAPYVIQLFEKLAMLEPLCPLTGEDDEWEEVDDGLYQNKRCSHVFKNNSRTYDINGKVFIDPSGVGWTSSESRVDVTFPYTPKTIYVYLEKSDLPTI